MTVRSSPGFLLYYLDCLYNFCIMVYSLWLTYLPYSLSPLSLPERKSSDSLNPLILLTVVLWPCSLRKSILFHLQKIYKLSIVLSVKPYLKFQEQLSTEVRCHPGLCRLEFKIIKKWKFFNGLFLDRSYLQLDRLYPWPGIPEYSKVRTNVSCLCMTLGGRS